MTRHGKRTRPRRAGLFARLEALEPRQLLATFAVTTVLDSGAGSLRAAILSSNATPGTSTIDFDIPGLNVHTIALLSPLPAAINPVIIDGASESGYFSTPLIELEGAGILDASSAPIPDVNGLTLTGGSSLVRALAINRFTGSGIVATRDGNTITGDFIGTDPTGSMALGNGGNGVAASGRNNFIGADLQDPPPGLNVRNVISGNAGAGINLGGTGSSLPTNNTVVGNLIGTDATGTVDLGNSGPGVDLESSNNAVGSSISPNIVAYNGGPGVQVGNSPNLSNVIDNRVVGNSIFQNVGLGIDLGGDGVTPNAPGFPFGPNQRQTFPVLTSAYESESDNTPVTAVEGSLTALPNTAYTVDFYSNTQPDRTGYGQGQTPLGAETFFTNSSGFAQIAFSTNVSQVPVGRYISATATDPGGNTSEFGFSRVVTPTAEADLSVTAMSSAPTAVAGTPQTYDYVVQNAGPSVARNVVFHDILPAGAILVSGTENQQSIPAPVDGVITAPLGDLTAGNFTVVALTYTLPAAGSFANKVGVTSDVPDLAPSNNSFAETIVVSPAAPVALSLYGVANPYPVQAGQPLTYTFVVSNVGFNRATGVMFSDPLPAGLTLTSVRSSQGTDLTAGNDVMVDLGTVMGGANATVTIVVAPTTPGPVSNFAMISSNEPVFDALNLSTTVFSYVNPPPTVDTAVVIQAAPVPATVGQPFAFNVLVGNPGTAPATGVTLTDVLPDAAAVASIRPSQGTYTLSGNVLTVDLGNVAVGQVTSVTIALIPGAPGVIVDRASVVANQPELDITNNFAAVATPVVGQPIAPAVLDQKLVVSGNRITGLVLTFDEDMDPNSASMIANYEVLDLGRNGSLSANGPKVAIASATYNASTRSVTLAFKSGLNIGRFYKVVVNGPGAPGLVDANGNVLDGENNGLQNSIYQSLIGRGTATRPVNLQVGVTRHQPTPKPAPLHTKAKRH